MLYKALTKSALVLILTSVPLSAHATNWVYVTSADKDNYFVDRDSIKQNGKYVNALTRADYAKPKDLLKRFMYKSDTQFHRYDCAANTSALIVLKVYEDVHLKGKLLGDIDFTASGIVDSKIMPNSVAEGVKLFVCK